MELVNKGELFRLEEQRNHGHQMNWFLKRTAIIFS
jgi:hypothetical protein